MKRRIWGALGTSLFWILWPAMAIYFKRGGTRSRVIVSYDGKFLMLQPWLGVKQYGLPGGGRHRHESLRAAAVRELFEETGIIAATSDLQTYGSYKHTQYGLIYNAQFYCLELDVLPQLRPSWFEVYWAGWFDLKDVDISHIDEDARFALKHRAHAKSP